MFVLSVEDNTSSNIPQQSEGVNVVEVKPADEETVYLSYPSRFKNFMSTIQDIKRFFFKQLITRIILAPASAIWQVNLKRRVKKLHRQHNRSIIVLKERCKNVLETGF